MVAKLDFAKVITLAPGQRTPLIDRALTAGQITESDAAALKKGLLPSEQLACGTTGYAGSTGNATTTKPLGPQSALFAMAMHRDLAEGPAIEAAAKKAKVQIDKLLGAIGTGSDMKAGVEALRKYLGTVGPDVVAALGGSTMDVSDNGIGYINSRLLNMGAGVTLEPIMDAQSRAAIKAMRPGELRGPTGSVHFSWIPFSAHALATARSLGSMDTGMWGATFQGTEAFNFKKDAQDSSVSAKVRNLNRNFSGGSLSEVVDDFVKMMGEQALPENYAFEIDLGQVPRAQHGDVKTALAGLEQYGAELRFLETDPAKIMASASSQAAVSRRIEKLLEKPQSEWNDADRAEYKEVHALSNAQPNRFE